MADQNIQNPRGLKQEAKADVRNGLKREPGVEEPAAKRARLNSHRSDGGASVSSKYIHNHSNDVRHGSVPSLNTRLLSEDVKARTSKSPDQSSSKSNGRKQKSSARKSLMIPPINLDSNGRPVLPLELPAGLTVYSLGEVRYSIQSRRGTLQSTALERYVTVYSLGEVRYSVWLRRGGTLLHRLSLSISYLIH